MGKDVVRLRTPAMKEKETVMVLAMVDYMMNIEGARENFNVEPIIASSLGIITMKRMIAVKEQGPVSNLQITL